MCGRFQLDNEDRDNAFQYRFNINNIDYKNLISSFNIAPSQKISVVVKKSPNRLVVMKWGLTPPWDKDGKLSIINVRSETVFEKKMFINMIETQRCLIPSTGFYEWKKTSDGKQPFYIGLKNKELFSFAGIYDGGSCAILTTSPNPLMTPIHNRMPVILQKDDEEDWLSPDMVEEEKIKEYLRPYKNNDLVAYPISTRVNSPFNNDSLIAKKIKV